MNLDQTRKSNNILQQLERITQNRLIAFLISLIITFLMLLNFILPLNAIIQNRDYILQLWDLWLVNESITHWQTPYFTQLQYYPYGAYLGRHVLCPGFFPITFLVQTLLGNDVLYPLYTYKIIILLSYSLILYFSYLTLQEIGLPQGASIIPAMAYTFGNFYMNHMNRLHIISAFYIPITAFFVIRLYKKPTMANAVICTLLLATGFYFTELTLFIYMAIFFLVVLIFLIPEERKKLLAIVHVLGIKGLLMLSVLYLLVMSVFLYNWFMSDALPPDDDETYRFTSNLAGFFIPEQETVPLYGTLFTPLSDKITAGHPEYYQTFLGFPTLLLGLIAIFRMNDFGMPKSRWLKISLALALIFFFLSLGQTLKIFSIDTKLLMPYALLSSVPPFNMGRTPIRFVSVGLFFWMIVAAFGLYWLSDIKLAKYGKPIVVITTLLIFAWTTAEIYTPVEREQPYVIPPQLEALVEGPVMNLPLRYHNGWALLPQIFHRQPMATGYVSRNSRQHELYWKTLQVRYEEALQSGSCEFFIEMGFKNILIWPEVPDDVVTGLTQSPDCPMNVVDFR